MSPEYFQRLSRYNRWANQRLYQASGALHEIAYKKNRGAFFGSLHGTLNHVLVGDRVWLARITGSETDIQRLDQVLYDDFGNLHAARVAEDARIVDLTDALTEEKLESILHYKTMAGAQQRTRLDMVYAHLFNHQTHHRGQAHTLLSLAGVEPPELDLIFFLRDA